MIHAFASRTVAVALSLLFASVAAAKTDLSELLTDEEFAAAGLDKLSPEELKRLDQLWDRYSGDTEEAPAVEPPSPLAPPVRAAAAAPEMPATVVAKADDLMGKEQLPIDEKKLPKEIRSRLVGSFDGWSGETKFTLENGQVWQQRIDDSVSYSQSENPEITVFRSLGGYRIRVEGYRQTCPVKRIQ